MVTKNGFNAWEWFILLCCLIVASNGLQRFIVVNTSSSKKDWEFDQPPSLAAWQCRNPTGFSQGNVCLRIGEPLKEKKRRRWCIMLVIISPMKNTEKTRRKRRNRRINLGLTYRRNTRCQLGWDPPGPWVSQRLVQRDTRIRGSLEFCKHARPDLVAQDGP